MATFIPAFPELLTNLLCVLPLQPAIWSECLSEHKDRFFLDGLDGTLWCSAP